MEILFAEDSYTLDLTEADQALRRLAHRTKDGKADALYAVVHAAFQDLMAQGHTVININDPKNPAFRRAYEWWQAFSQSKGDMPGRTGRGINPLDISPVQLVAYLQDTFRVPTPGSLGARRGLVVTSMRVGTMTGDPKFPSKQTFQAAPGAGEGELSLTDASLIGFVAGSTTGRIRGSHPGAAAVEVTFTFMGVALTACIYFHSPRGTGSGLIMSSTFGRVVMGGQMFTNMADALSGMTRLDARARAYGLTARFSPSITSNENVFTVDILQGSAPVAKGATLSYVDRGEHPYWKLSFKIWTSPQEFVEKTYTSPQSFVDDVVKGNSVLSAQVQSITDALKVGDAKDDRYLHWITGFTWVDVNAFTVEVGLRQEPVGSKDFEQIGVVYTFTEVDPGMYQVHVSLPGSTAAPLPAFHGPPLSLEDAVQHVATLTSTLYQLRPQGKPQVGWYVEPGTVVLIQDSSGNAVLGFDLVLKQGTREKLAVAVPFTFSSLIFTFQGGLDVSDLKTLSRFFREVGNLPVIEKVGDGVTGATIQLMTYDPVKCEMEFSISAIPRPMIAGEGQPYTRARFNARTGAFALFHQATGTWHDWGSYQTWWATYALSLKTVSNTGGNKHIRNVVWQSFDGSTGVRFSFDYYDAQAGDYVSTTGTAGTKTKEIEGQEYTVPSFKVQEQGSDVEYTDVRIFAAIHALGLDVQGGVGTVATWQASQDAAGPTVAFKINDPAWEPSMNYLDVKFDADSGLFSYSPHVKMSRRGWMYGVPFLWSHSTLAQYI